MIQYYIYCALNTHDCELAHTLDSLVRVSRRVGQYSVAWKTIYFWRTYTRYPRTDIQKLATQLHSDSGNAHVAHPARCNNIHIHRHMDRLQFGHAYRLYCTQSCTSSKMHQTVYERIHAQLGSCRECTSTHMWQSHNTHTQRPRCCIELTFI